MKSIRQQFLRFAFEIGIILAIYFFLRWWLASGDIVACLFAAGSHVPWFKLMIALAFIILHLVVVLYLPARILVALGLFTWDAWMKKH